MITLIKIRIAIYNFIISLFPFFIFFKDFQVCLCIKAAQEEHVTINLSFCLISFSTSVV